MDRSYNAWWVQVEVKPAESRTDRTRIDKGKGKGGKGYDMGGPMRGKGWGDGYGE